jgi:hypothetical protein
MQHQPAIRRGGLQACTPIDDQQSPMRPHHSSSDEITTRRPSGSAPPAPTSDVSDDVTIQAGLAGLRSELDRANEKLDAMERRARSLPHRARYLKRIDDYGRRSLDPRRDSLEAVEPELDRPPG